jgi:putative alpha-1,2-mannosidase
MEAEMKRHFLIPVATVALALGVTSAAWAQAAPPVAVTPVVTPLQSGITTGAISDATTAATAPMGKESPVPSTGAASAGDQKDARDKTAPSSK